MTLTAIRARSLSEQVFEQLASAIVTGKYPPGSTLQAERTLTGVFGVNRHVVREALKRLEQVGLVKVSQGGGTRVMDFRKTAGLDLLALMSEHARGGYDVAQIWLAVLEMRAAIGADVARLCALRASPALKNEILILAQQMATTKDDEVLYELEIKFWELVADGADNIAYRLSLNSLLKSGRARGHDAKSWALEDLKRTEFRLPVARAIHAGDAVAAEAAMRSAMRQGVEFLTAILANARASGTIEKAAASGTDPAP